MHVEHCPIDTSRASQKALNDLGDRAVCSDCLREVFDPANRRHRYAFTSCSRCGPRFTILHSLPWERHSTTMAPFAMCLDCRREYDSPTGRRFRAAAIACPACGPRLSLRSMEGHPLPTTDPIGTAARYLEAGLTVAVKGVGGYHLVCDATDAGAVGRLRHRKQKDHRPFSVMVRDLAAAERLARIGAVEAELLGSPERPIVVAARRDSSGLAAEVAPCSDTVGLALADTPLHHLLLAEFGRPLAITSGNLSSEPIAYRDDEAVERLAGLADALLCHDRAIAVRCDDSVARAVAGAPVVLRRSRGFVPVPIPVARPFDRPVLACGGQHENAFCIGLDGAAYLGPHVGDLETLDTVEAFEQAVEKLCDLLLVRPEIIAHDLHPGYLSTAYALEQPGAFKIGVQHHHAHVASAMGEHGLDGRVIGIAYDGGGYGRDGQSWGGEVVVADLEEFDRVATFRAMPLPVGGAGTRPIWRLALALLEDAFEGSPPLEAFALFDRLPQAELDLVRRLLGEPGRAQGAHGLAHYIEAFGALFLGRHHAAHHGGPRAHEWSLVAEPGERGRYPYEADRGTLPWSIDLRPMLRAAVEDLQHGVAPGTIAARFHNTLAAATAETVAATVRRYGPLPVVLTGGCFQDPLLADRVGAALPAGLAVFRHRQVPPGDGGIALGQALIADAVTRSAEALRRSTAGAA
jgi:hydrogenase maturation protein HypF